MIAGGWANLAGGPAAVAAASGATAAADAGGAGEGPDATAEARASGGPAAADWLVVGEVNQQALFRRVAAVVHHGGAGTTTTAALAGAPQVVVPQIVDQPHWARRVQELGTGVAHPGPVPTVESLTDALRTALAPAMLARARAVAPEIRTDGATIAARLLQAS